VLKYKNATDSLRFLTVYQTYWKYEYYGTRTHQDYYGQYGAFEMASSLTKRTIYSGHIPSFLLTYFKESKPVLVSECSRKIHE
jgi:hypothetical protein